MKSELNLDVLTETIDDLSIGIGIFHVDDINDLESLRYIFMNKVVLYEMRKTREEVFGKRIIEVAPEAYAHEVGLQVIETYRKVAVEKESINLGVVEYSNEMVAGKYECSVHHIVDHYIYVMLRNVTELEETKNQLAEINKNLEKIVEERTKELKHSEEELKEANEHLEERVKERTALLELKNKELSQFAYVASHDLQEPLRTIRSFIQLLEEDISGKLTEKEQKYFHFITEASSRMSELINALLEYSKIGRKKTLTAINCNEILHFIQEDLQNVIEQSQTQIHLDSLPSIIALETEIRLLFQNLISNAIKFSREGVHPQIWITAEENQDGWTFRIKDNGIGIDPKHQEQIFTIFNRLHTRDVYEGTGIGLAHCQKIIDLHQGKIWVESELGQGSTFCFSIPKLTQNTLINE